MFLNSERSMNGAPAQTCNLWRRQMDAFVDNDNVEFVISFTWNFFGYTVSPHPSLGVLFFLFHFIHSPPPSNLYQGKENILFSLPSYRKMSVWEITFQFIKHWINSDQSYLFIYCCTCLSFGMQNLVPWPKFKVKLPVLGAQSLRFLKWTRREVPVFFINQLFTAVKAPDWLVYQKAENNAPLQVYHCLPDYSWRRKWQPSPVFLPGESQGQGSLVGCRLWGRTELDTTEAT